MEQVSNRKKGKTEVDKALGLIIEIVRKHGKIDKKHFAK